MLFKQKRDPETLARNREIEARLAALPDPDLDDPDNPEWTEEDFARAVGPEHLPPEVLAAFPRTAARLRGRPPAPVRKTPVSLRLDPDVVEHFRSTGAGWQSRINDLLRAAMKAA